MLSEMKTQIMLIRKNIEPWNELPYPEQVLMLTKDQEISLGGEGQALSVYIMLHFSCGIRWMGI